MIRFDETLHQAARSSSVNKVLLERAETVAMVVSAASKVALRRYEDDRRRAEEGEEAAAALGALRLR